MSAYDLLAQCIYSERTTITDLNNGRSDTTLVTIIIEGTEVNDLSHDDQGVCGVQLEFTHPFVKDLAIELISPAGQVVRLVGGTIRPSNTPFIRWNVTFVPCATTANPDFGFSEIWENDQSWQSFTNYNGQYYPHLGCLENFNMGSVDGSWTLRCIDFEDGGQGTLISAALIFCNDEGIDCSVCSLDAGSFSQTSIESCQGDTLLDNSFEKIYESFPPDSTKYIYTNIIFNGDSILRYDTVPLPSLWTSGRYTVCGLQYAIVDSTYIPTLGEDFTPESLSNYFFENGVCAALSQNCLDIIINPSLEPIFLDTTICAGDLLIVGDEILYLPGVYNVLIPNEPCDSLVVVTLHHYEFDIQIQGDKTEISCTDTELSLSGAYLGSNFTNLSYQWSTENGLIINGNTQEEVLIGSSGLYTLIMSGAFNELTCYDTVQITIVRDETFPVLTIESDTLTCKNNSVDIRLYSSIPLINEDWESTNGASFIVNPSGITTSDSGMYIVEARGENDCVVTDSIFVAIDTIFVDISFEVDTLTCFVDTVFIISQGDISTNYLFLWEGVDITQQNVRSPWITNPGIYQLNVINNDNGCQRTFNVPVLSEQKRPQVTDFNVDTLTCENLIVEPNFDVDVLISNFSWMGADLSSNEAKPQISSPGIYTVTFVSSINSCDTTFSFEVIQDTLLPEISVKNDTLTCDVDSILLSLNIVSPFRSVAWSGPNGFVSQLQNPKVSEHGRYFITVTGLNGCHIRDSIDIIKSLDFPFVVFESDSLTCAEDTVMIRIVQEDGLYTYEWSGPDLLDKDMRQPKITSPGLYRATVTDISTGCKDTYEVEVIDYRIFSDVQLVVPELKCTEDSVQVLLQNIDTKSMVYFINGNRIDELSPFVSQLGTYIYEFTNQYHCVTIDSFVLQRNDTIPEILLDFGKIVCFQDSILVTAQSNVAIKDYTWSSMDGTVKNGQQVYWYQGGEYSVTLTGENECKNTQNFVIEYDTIAPDFTVNPYSSLTCQDSLINLSLNTNDTYKKIRWMPADIVSDSLIVNAPGTYEVILIGDNNCESSQVLTVLEDKIFPEFEINASVINCRNQVSLITLSPTTEYKEIRWDNARNPVIIADNETIIPSSFPGFYFFEIENDQGCVLNGEVVILRDTDPPRIVDKVTDTISCHKSCATLKISSPDTLIRYIWNGPDIEDLIAGDSICVNTPGSYFLQVTGRNFCNAVVEFLVEIDNQQPNIETFTDTLSCNVNAVPIGILTADSDLIYSWDGPDIVSPQNERHTVTIPGVYTVVATAPNGCSVEREVIVEGDFSKPDIKVNNEVVLPCDSSVVEIFAMSQLELHDFRWIFPNGSILNTPTILTDLLGDYFMQASGPNGCISDTIFFSVVPDSGDLSLSFETDTLTCNRNIVPLNIFSQKLNVSYTIFTPDNNLLTNSNNEVSISGLYIVEGRDVNGCVDTLEVFVPVDTLRPIIVVDSMGQILCTHRSVILNGVNSTSGNLIDAIWQGDPNHFNLLDDYTINISEPGEYTFLLRNLSNGCSSQESFFIEESLSLFDDLDESIINPLCNLNPFGTLSLGEMNGRAPFIVFLDDINVGTQRVFSNLLSGQYNIRVIDADGCILEKDIDIPDLPEFTIDLPSIITIGFGDSLVLTPSFSSTLPDEAIVTWYDRGHVICSNCRELTVVPSQNTIYRVVITVGEVCSFEVEVLVQVNRQMFNAIPNIFNPNSTQGNDRFYIPQTRGIEKINHIYIFDRWAENVFKVDNVSPGDASWGWDGTFAGKECQPGVYVVIAEWTLIDGTIIKYKGDVTIVR